jgi:tetratricopeptide (TPR) repeat protein
MRALHSVLVAILLLGAARADVVVLKSGGTISGTVVKDTPTEVVVKTPSGKVVLPRRLVKKVVKQSGGQTLLALANERYKAGALDEARKLYQRAAKDSDPQVAARARAGLAKLGRRDAKVSRYRKAPRWPLLLPKGVTGKALEGGSLQVQFDRARRAIEDGRGQRAVALLAPMVEGHPQQGVLRYLHGRALELAGKLEPAREALGVAAGRSDKRPLAWLRELARRRTSGEVLKGSTPGRSQSTWKRRQTARFAFYALHEMDDSLVGSGESLFQEVLSALDVRVREVPLPGRIQVFVFADGPSLGEARRAGLPEGRRMAPDGPLWMVAATAARLRSALRDAIGQAAAETVFPGLPTWARVGTAELLAPAGERREHLTQARARRKRLVTFDDLISGKGSEGETATARRSFRAQAGIVLELLKEERKTLRKALKLCQKIDVLGGPVKAFARFRVSLDRVKGAYDVRLGVE